MRKVTVTERWKTAGGGMRREGAKLFRKLLQKSRQKVDTGHEVGRENSGGQYRLLSQVKRREASAREKKKNKFRF